VPIDDAAHNFYPRKARGSREQGRRGTWQLLVNDDDATVVGALNCWELTIPSRAKKK
jgi:subtilisin-like proprotein convertase family protein